MDELHNLRNAVWNEERGRFSIYDPDEQAMITWGAIMMRNSFIKIIDKLEADFVNFTELLDEHPEEWDGPCLCKLCQSYGDIEEE